MACAVNVLQLRGGGGQSNLSFRKGFFGKQEWDLGIQNDQGLERRKKGILSQRCQQKQRNKDKNG